MSLRPLQHPVGQVARAGQRMAPGGRRWSESPIPREGRRRVRRMGKAAAALYWFKFDEATATPAWFGGPDTVVMEESGDYLMMFAESGTGAFLDPNIVSGIAPSSSGAVAIAGCSGYFDGTVSPVDDAFLYPGADGLIVLDWWMSGFTGLHTGRGQAFVVVDNRFGYYHCRTSVTASELEFTNSYYGSGDPVHTVGGFTGAPTHIRWEIRPATAAGGWENGESRVLVDGVEKASATGVGDIWMDSAGVSPLDCYLIAPAGGTVTFDEFKIYGSATP